MGIILYTLIGFIISVMDCIGYILVGYIILGWFVFFGVIKNSNNPLLKIYLFLMTKIEPFLAIIRGFIPPVFGLDFSAMLVFFGLYLAKIIVVQLAILISG